MPAKKKKRKTDTESLRQKLKLKHLRVKDKLQEVHPHAKKFFEKKGVDPAKIREHSARLLGAGAVTGAMLLTSPDNLNALPAPDDVINKFKSQKEEVKKDQSHLGDPHKLITETIKDVLPKQTRPLDRREEKFLERIFENVMGVPARATLEGEHLNTTYGYIGAEQHLRRYPGDTLSQHGEGEVIEEGMAPGLGAWGYFANSKSEMTPELEEIERWYAVVQTLYLPDWNTRQPYLKNWYKHRKVLIVNTENGNAVVASIADSGPAAWTGKHFGGSPEVMHHLGGPRYKKGPVIIFFVDDPENKMPLGPVEYGENLPSVVLEEV